MDDLLKVWTSAGSAGTLNDADLAKVNLHQSIVQLGTELVQPPPNSSQAADKTADFALMFPTVQAVVRYNVTPVDGLFLTGKFRYHLQLRYRGRVTATLMQVDIETGADTPRIVFDSASFPAQPGFQVQAVFEKTDSVLLDFVNKAYYVEATLTTATIVIGNPAAISIVKVFASPNFSG